MSHTERAWRSEDGSDPYGRPQAKGNADEVWRLLGDVPCPGCGAPAKHLTIEGDRATIRCGHPTPDAP